MNIFVLDPNPQVAARYHNNRHVVKMILETAQLLCIAHVYLDGAATARARVAGMLNANVALTSGGLLKRSQGGHINHPCAKWARTCRANYRWLQELGVALVAEHHARYGRMHAYGGAHGLMATLATLPLNMPVARFGGANRGVQYPLLPGGCPWPQCFGPNAGRYVNSDPVEAYRNYYFGEKGHIAEWSAPAEVPSWWIDRINKLKLHTRSMYVDSNSSNG